MLGKRGRQAAHELACFLLVLAPSSHADGAVGAALPHKAVHGTPRLDVAPLPGKVCIHLYSSADVNSRRPDVQLRRRAV